MKHSTRISAYLVAGIASVSLLAAPMALAAPGELDDAEATALAFNREEERLARDLYQVFADQYDGARPFSRIVAAEQQHMDQVGVLLTNYGLPDPSAGSVPGVYADAELQAAYDKWYAQGMVSIEAAYQVGIELETMDIAELEASIAATDEADIQAVYDRLKAGSENHLAAYQRAADGTYAAGQGTRTPRGGQGFGDRQCDGTCDGTGAQQGPAGQGGQGMGQQGTGQPGAGQEGTGQPGTGQGRGGQGQGAQQGPADGSRPGAGTGDCPYVS